MYIPSGEILKLIMSEQYGVWAESYQNKSHSALIIKAKSSTLKAVADGCHIKLFIGVCTDSNEDKYLSAGVQIFDSIDTPLLIPGMFRLEKEQTGMLDLLNNRNFVLAFYDEMDSNVCTAKGKINKRFSEPCLAGVGPIEDLNLVANGVLANDIIDSICYSINPAYGTSNKFETIVFSGDLEISDISTHLVLSQGLESSIAYEINAKSEGLTQEKQLYHAISSAFESGVFHSPEIRTGKRQRELTDVLIDYQGHFYLIESKAMSINESGFNKTLSRKQSGVANQVKKALGQLEGALKVIQRKEDVKTSSGEPISIPTNSTLHGVVLISEFYPTWNWDEIVEQIYEVYSTTQCLIHLMDLGEFINMLKLSLRPSIHFNQSMIERFTAFYNNGNLNIRSIDSSLPFKF